MTLRIPWDIYEVALLLDTCIKVINKELPRSVAVKQLSENLRRKAQHQNIEFDSIFRNENGISMQMTIMIGLLRNEKSGLHNSSKLFNDIHRLYLLNKEEYEQILEEAKGMVAVSKNIEKDFYHWLAKKVPSSFLADYSMNFNDIEDYCLKRNILKDKLFCTTDIDTLGKVRQIVLKNGNFRFKYQGRTTKMSVCMKYYIEYIEEYIIDKKEVFIKTDKTLIDQKEKTKKGQEDNIIEKKYYDYLERLVVENRINYIDKRPENGCLWLIDSKRTKNFIKETSSKLNVIFRFKKGGGITTKGQSAWWTTKIIKEKESIQANSFSSSNNDDNEIIINFDNLGKLEYTKPFYFSYFSEEHINIKSWCDLYVNVVKVINDDYSYELKNWMNKNLNNSGRMDFADTQHSNLMVTPKEITSDFYLETNLSAIDTVRKIKRILDICRVDYENLIIKIRSKKNVANLLHETTSVDTKEKETKVIDLTLKKQIKEIFEQNFRGGFRYDSRIDYKKFCRFYKLKYAIEEDISNEQLNEYIKYLCKEQICIENNGFFYLSSTLLSDENEKKIFEYINNTFLEGAKFIFYSSIMNKFTDLLVYEHIPNEKILSSYLKAKLSEKYYFYDTYFSKSRLFSVSCLSEIEQFLFNKNYVVTKSEIISNFHYVSEEQIDKAIKDSKYIVRNAKKEYFHSDIIDFTEKEIQRISYLINSQIDKYEFITAKELKTLIKRDMPEILERYVFLSDMGFREVLSNKLGKDYYFKANIISSQKNRINTNQVYATFCKTHDSFSMDDLDDLKEQIDTNIYFETVYDNSIRVSYDSFISYDHINFDIENTDEAISRFFAGDYVFLSEITDFGTFPYCEYKWTTYLLESYLWSFSRKYKLMHIRFGKNFSGVIIKRSSNYYDYDECLVDIIADNSTINTTEEALVFLSEKKCLNSQKYKNIKNIFQSATIKRTERMR